MVDLDELLREAERLPVGGWSFDRIRDRWRTSAPPWDLKELIRGCVGAGSSLLDLGTGGGEFLESVLTSLPVVPARVVATEGYAPNLPIARARLEPRGVSVISLGGDHRIDLPERSVDVVMDRHTAFEAREVARVLKPGGRFVTQQVGGSNYRELALWFGVEHERSFNRLGSCRELAEEIAPAGFTIQEAREESHPEPFLDVGALVYFLRMAPWEVPGFSVERFRPVLSILHREVERRGHLELTAQRLLVVARRS
jgi:SAM-dependent methyltransferase